MAYQDNTELQHEMEELSQRFEREDAEAEKAPEEPPALRDITTYEGFGGTGVTPRRLDGLPYAESLD